MANLSGLVECCREEAVVANVRSGVDFDTSCFRRHMPQIMIATSWFSAMMDQARVLMRSTGIYCDCQTRIRLDSDSLATIGTLRHLSV
jgi:hypothetical protein